MAEPTNDSSKELHAIVEETKNKGCLMIGFIFVLIIGVCTLAVWLDFFPDNLPFIIIGLVAVLLLPIVGLTGLIRNIMQSKNQKEGEAASSIAGFVLLTLIGIALIIVILNFFNNFRWPG